MSGSPAADRLLVSLDVDGTLIDTEFDDHVRPREIAALRAVREAGHELALCTGRNAMSTAKIVASAGGALDDVGLVLLNGALVVGGRPSRRLRHATLGREVLRRLVLLFREYGLAPVLFASDGDGGHVTHEDLAVNPVLARYLSRRRETVGGIEVVDDLLAALPADALELGTIGETDRVLTAGERIGAELGGAVRVIHTQSLLADGAYMWLEVYHRDCDKGSGVRLLAEALGFDRGRIVAIGDNFNDLDMFAAAGHRVAMGNAPEAVRAAADRVGPPVRDHGAAVVLEEIARGAWPV